MEPKGAALMEEEETMVAGVVIAKECQEMVLDMSVAKAEQAEASAQGVANAGLQDTEIMEPVLAESSAKEESEAAVECALEAVIIADSFDERDEHPVAVTVPVTKESLQGILAKTPGQEVDPEAGLVVVPDNDVFLTIEDCSGELRHDPFESSGDGDGDEGQNALIGSIKVVTEQGSPKAEFPEADLVAPAEPAWGDVPDEPAPESVPEPVPVQRTPCFPKRQRPAPENVEVDDVVQTMRNILMDLRNVDDARLHPDDDAKVRSLLQYHPQAEAKMGSGIDYIKIKRHSEFKDSRCFWVVRTDGSETDFSYHKCLKEKVAKDHPTFTNRYDAVYRAPKRPRQA